MSAIEIVDELINKALSSRSSDIHLEPGLQRLEARFRIDGLLYAAISYPVEAASQIVARIKVLSYLDTAEKRLPQDGKFSYEKQGSVFDLRVATFPCLYGEKVVIRILERSSGAKSLAELGLSLRAYTLLSSQLMRATGFFLVCGPTGSGKTTTLYALLNALKTAEKNIVTLEDPIEYTIEGVTQGQIHPEIGFTFARGIRALLRQDPDIIMVGEIRDTETAEVALQAGLTGHLVLSTLHTHDAPSVLIRLLDMGVPAYLINATVTCILAQRLVRVLCSNCREMSTFLTDLEKAVLSYLRIEVKQSYGAKGCSQCYGRGYKGRTGIFEILLVSPSLRYELSKHALHDRLYDAALKDGMLSLHHDAVDKIESGITSIAEVARAI